MLLRCSVTANNIDPPEGAPAEVLVDGAETPLTANGLPGYIPTPGDRLLIDRVGTQIEILQFLTRGTVPYVSNTTDLTAEVARHDDSLNDLSPYTTTTNNDLQVHKAYTSDALSVLQPKHDALASIAAGGIGLNQIWVGNGPNSVTAKSISALVQNSLGAATSEALGAALGYWARSQIGDLQYSGAPEPPMTTFYTQFTANGRTAEPWI